MACGKAINLSQALLELSQPANKLHYLVGIHAKMAFLNDLFEGKVFVCSDDYENRETSSTPLKQTNRKKILREDVSYRQCGKQPTHARLSADQVCQQIKKAISAA